MIQLVGWRAYRCGWISSGLSSSGKVWLLRCWHVSIFEKVAFFTKDIIPKIVNTNLNNQYWPPTDHWLMSSLPKKTFGTLSPLLCFRSLGLSVCSDKLKCLIPFWNHYKARVAAYCDMSWPVARKQHVGWESRQEEASNQRQGHLIPCLPHISTPFNPLNCARTKAGASHEKLTPWI